MQWSNLNGHTKEPMGKHDPLIAIKQHLQSIIHQCEMFSAISRGPTRSCDQVTKYSCTCAVITRVCKSSSL